MKKAVSILLAISLVIIGVVAASAQTPIPQTAPKTVDEATLVLPNTVKNLIDANYKGLVMDKDISDLQRSTGYRINYISLEKLLDSGRNSLSAILEENKEVDYLYYLSDDSKPLILFTMTDDGSSIYMKSAGGFAGSFAESVSLVKKLYKDAEIMICRYAPMWGDYVIVFKADGESYVLPFDSGKDVLSEYCSVTDYRQLPTLDIFLEKLSAMYTERKVASERDKASGGSGIIYGLFECRPKVRDIK